uniref:Uncharacterized protein n=1 Tax=Glossina austeni TaxID=7395 RepID=A0A1A9UXD7_GLOAU
MLSTNTTDCVSSKYCRFPGAYDIKTCTPTSREKVISSSSSSETLTRLHLPGNRTGNLERNKPGSITVQSNIKQRTPPRSKLSKALASKSEISTHCLFSDMRNSSSSESILKPLKKPNQASSCNSLQISSSISSSSSSFSSSADDASLGSSCNDCNFLFTVRNEELTVNGLVFPKRSCNSDVFSQNYRTAINTATKKKVVNKVKVIVQKMIFDVNLLIV